MLENLKTLRQAKSRRIFVYLTLVTLVLELGLLTWVQFKESSLHVIFFDISKEVLVNLIGTTFAAAILVVVIVYFVPSELEGKEFECLDPDKTGKAHRDSLERSDFWNHNGHLGRWVRTDAMPHLAKKAITRTSTTRVGLIILDPMDDKVCKTYLRYRKNMTFRENIESADDIKLELLATIICGQLYHQDPSGLKVEIFFNKQFNLVREDVNSCAAFRTNVSPKYNCLIFHNNEGGNELYNTANQNFGFVSHFCTEFKLEHDIPIENKSELTTEMIRVYLEKSKLLVNNTPAFLAELLARVQSDYNPYR